MPDFRAYVKRSLRLPDAPGAEEAEIIEELALDLEDRYDRAVAEGQNPVEAWNRVQAQIDWPKVTRDLCAAFPRDRMVQPDSPIRPKPIRNLWNDVRYAVRTLRKSPGFTVVALTTIALCLGANLTIFAVMDSILLRPLPFPAADRLVTTVNTYPKSGAPHGSASLPNYLDYREKIKAFASTSIITRASEHAIVGAPGSPYRVIRDRISPEFFSTLSVPLLIGRSFTNDEMDYARSGVAIITYPFWSSYFNADANVLGRKFQMDGVPITVVGVLPPGFRYLSRQTQFFIPAAFGPQERATDQRHNNRFQLIARLAPNATLSTARAQVAALNAEQLKDDPFAADLKAMGFAGVVSGLQADHVETAKPLLLLLQGGVLFLLLMGSVNLVNLLLVRAAGRSKELAIRQALGAGRSHVVSSVVAETVLLSLLGGMFGLLVAAVGIRFLETLGVNRLPLGSYIAFDARLAAVALVAAVALGLLIALPVAWFNLRGLLAQSMQAESRGGTPSRAAQRVRHAFIVAQVALAFILQAGAGLLGVSMKHALETSPGFQTEHVLSGQLSLPYKRYPNPESSVALVDRVVRALQAQPGILTASASTLMPFRDGGDNGVTSIEGVNKGEAGNRVHYRNGVFGNYWQTMGIPLLEGRYLEDADNTRPQRVCAVDQAFARRYWPGKNPLGHRLNDGPVFNTNEAFTIVGVVASVKQSELDDTKLLGTVYYPYKYWANSDVSIVVRTHLPLEAAAPELRSAILQIDPELPIDGLKRTTDLIDESLVLRRSPAVLAGVFAAVALLLTAVGTYGVLAYAVGQRRREIGMRMALGAEPKQVLHHFLAFGGKLLLAGLAIGLFGAWAVGTAMQTLLLGVGPTHIGVLASSAGLVTGVVFFATLLPSRRASLISPTEALRGT